MAHKYIKVPFSEDNKDTVTEAIASGGFRFACEEDFKWCTVDAGPDHDQESEQALRRLVKPLGTNAYVYYVDRPVRDDHFNK